MTVMIARTRYAIHRSEIVVVDLVAKQTSSSWPAP
jgi:hypothetical protein